MRVLVTLILAFAQSAQAFSFGTGMLPGMDCPSEFGAAPGSFSGMDEVSNINGQLTAAEEELEKKEDQLEALDEDIAEARRMIKRVVKSSRALADIERHYEYRAYPEDYSPTCNDATSPGERGASAGSQSSNVVNRPSRGSAQGKEDPGLYKVPLDYCIGGQNDWQYVVAEDGMVLDEICEFEVPLSSTPPDKSRVEDCQDGLDLYYKRMAQKEKLKKEIAELNEEIEDYDRDREEIEDEIAEGTYCPFCNNERGSGSQMGAGKFLGIGVALLTALYQRHQEKRERKRQQPMLMAVPRMPGFPGPAAFMGGPIASPLPGYHGIHPGYGPEQGIYGAVPGAIGPGAFACQGTSPFGANNPFAPPFAPFMNGQANPFSNPYANPYAPNPYGQPPYAQSPFNQNPFAPHPLLMPGHGPGFSPLLGNGLQNYWGQTPNPYAPGILPYQGPTNPWAVNPNAPFGNPLANPLGPAIRFPTGVPGQVPGVPFNLGGPRFPIINPNQVVGGPGAVPYMGPAQNFGHQLYQMQQGVQQIGNGSYINGLSPPILPLVPERPAPIR